MGQTGGFAASSWLVRQVARNYIVKESLITPAENIRSQRAIAFTLAAL